MPDPQVPPRRPLHKYHSWSPDAGREEAWLRRKESHLPHRRRCGPSSSSSLDQRIPAERSVSDDDLEELRGCIDLGFGFGTESPELDPKLSRTLPALGFYCAVNKQYGRGLSRASSSSSIASDCSDSSSTISTIFDQSDDPETVKMRLRQWAQVVACSVRQFSGEPH